MCASEVKFKIHPSAIVIIAFFIWDKSFAKLLLSAILHELGHAAAAFLAGRRSMVFTLSPFGWSLYTGGLGGRGSLGVLLAGPAVSLALVPWLSPETVWILLFNLIPVLPLDGGRIFSELFGERAALGLGGYALLGALLLCFLHDVFPSGIIVMLLLHRRYLTSASYIKIKRAADFLQDLY